MRDGFVRVAAITPKLRIADVEYNTSEIIKRAREASTQGAKIIVFPELSITGADCRDLFLNASLLRRTEEELFNITESLKDLDAITFVGLPVSDHGSIYNAVAAISRGEVLGLVPKSLIGHDSHTEGRPFSAGTDYNRTIVLSNGMTAVFGKYQLFACSNIPELVIGVELGEDYLLPEDPAVNMAINGAQIIVIPSATTEGVTSQMQRRVTLMAQSTRLHVAYVYAGAGWHESTTDSVNSGARVIIEDGQLLGEGELFTNGMLITELDMQALLQQRLSDSMFCPAEDGYDVSYFKLDSESELKNRTYNPLPFIPEDSENVASYCKDVFDIQVHGLMKRILHTNAKKVVIGVSGGLDSTLALLVCIQTMKLLKRESKDVLAITMPGFGTTDRTYENAVEMIKCLGAEFREIPIRNAVSVHFEDIGQSLNNYDVTYENAQARERTQILMDVANMEGGLVVGTGDLSELALGWATYNGDHMSMYDVNGAVSKTLIRFVIRYYMDEFAKDDEKLKKTLVDVIETPISPELIPSKDGKIEQKTEKKVGPYELSDFYLYYCLGYGFGPIKIYRLACNAFEGLFTPEEIKHWLSVFYDRFFSQQYKRSCLCDGPGIGIVGVSPRGSLRMPSDASNNLWKNELMSLDR